MRRALRWAGITLGLGVLALVTLAPREPVEMGAAFEPRKFFLRWHLTYTYCV